MTDQYDPMTDDHLSTQLRRKMVLDILDQPSALLPLWRAILDRVPRHPFVPRIFVSPDNDGWYAPVDGTDPAQRDTWLRHVYTDDICVTQLDGDDRAWANAVKQGKIQGELTCTSSQPSLMAVMLRALDIHDNQRVLEIGTGTGYNAALLCDRLGASLVTSIDVDPVLIQEARHALERLDLVPTLAVADGSEGYALNAPYDRVIATCSFPEVPFHWIEQVRADGVLLVNLHRPLGGGILARLNVTGDGTASGPFQPDHAGFMPTRRLPSASEMKLYEAAAGQDGNRRSADLQTETALRHTDFRFFAALLMRDVSQIWSYTDDDRSEHWLLGDDGSWARQTPDPDGALKVIQAGPQRLFDRLETLERRWRELGRPVRERFGLTVTRDHQQLWLDEPGNAVPGFS